jgi:hypothetical protein
MNNQNELKFNDLMHTQTNLIQLVAKKNGKRKFF